MFPCAGAATNQARAIWNKYSGCICMKSMLYLMGMFAFVFFPPYSCDSENRYLGNPLRGTCYCEYLCF